MPNLDDHKLEIAIRDVIVDICEVMYKRGYQMVSIGALMRLLGIDSERASKHDDEFFSLDDEFETMLQLKKQTRHAPKGATLH